MRLCRAAVFCGCLLTSIIALGDDAAPRNQPAIRLRRADQSGNMATFAAESAKIVKLPANQAHSNSSDATFEVVGLPPELLARLRGETADQALAAELLQVYVASASRPLLGSYVFEKDVLRFQPRFPLEPSVAYRARLALPPLDADSKRKRITTRTFEIPPRPTISTARVEQVYPTGDVLPENQLKFYLHFSAPMSFGQAYEHVHLLDSAGKPIEGAFLEIGEELWDRSGRRFTLFFDPGRIKRGLKPREDLGPALEEGKSYTLVIDRAWQDANGNPLTAEFRKAFRVIGPDDTPPSEKNWKIERPASENGFVLTVDFREPLDHALLQRVVWVEATRDSRQSERVAGKVDISRHETRWQFMPEKPLAADARYYLMAEKILEDRAGNSLGSKFEVDVFDRVDKQTSTEQVRILIAGPREK